MEHSSHSEDRPFWAFWTCSETMVTESVGWKDGLKNKVSKVHKKCSYHENIDLDISAGSCPQVFHQKLNREYQVVTGTDACIQSRTVRSGYDEHWTHELSKEIE